MKKKLYGVVCMLLFACLIFAGCGENAQIKYVRQKCEKLSFKTTSGYEQEIVLKNGEFEYTSYSKQVMKNGENYKITETSSVLNNLDSDEKFTTTKKTSYIVGDKLYEQDEEDFVYSSTIKITFGLNIEIKEDNFIEFTLEGEEQKTFTASVKEVKFSKYVSAEQAIDIDNMNIRVEIDGDKVTKIILSYETLDSTKVTISNIIYNSLVQFELPSLNG